MQEQTALVRSALALQIAITIPLVVIAVIAAAPLTRLLFDFQDLSKMESAVGLFRAVIPYAALAGAAAVLMGALHTRGVFVVPALAPLLFSVGVISAVLALAPSLGIYAVAVGIVGGGVLQLVLQVPSFLRHGFSLLPRLRVDHRLRRIIRGWGPAMLSAIVFVVVQQIAMLLASGLGDRSTSAIGYAVVFFQLPLGVLSVSVVTAAFPKLAVMAAAGRDKELRRSVADGLVTITALLVPAAIVYLLLSEDIIRVALERGRFDPRATKLTAAVLRGYAIGLPSVGLFTFLQRLCYALDTPVRALRASIAVGIIDVILSIWWRQTSFGVVGLALANSAAFTVGAVLLAVSSRQVSSAALRTGALKIAVGAAPAVALLWGASRMLLPAGPDTTGVVQIIMLVAVVTATAAVTIVMYQLVGLPFVRRLIGRGGKNGHDRSQSVDDR